MLKALGSGLVGACALTLIHETARRFIDDAPRMDVLGMRALSKAARAADLDPPVPLHEAALVGDLVSNSLYYSLVGAGSRREALRNGALLGLGRQPTEDSPQTQLMTVAWYLLGGLAAGAAYRALASDEE